MKCNFCGAKPEDVRDWSVGLTVGNDIDLMYMSGTDPICPRCYSVWLVPLSLGGKAVAIYVKDTGKIEVENKVNFKKRTVDIDDAWTTEEVERKMDSKRVK